MRIARLLAIRSTLLAVLALLALSLSPGGPVASAEESDGLVTRLIDVSALVSGRPEFVRVQEPSGADGMYDEDSPLFGAEGGEWSYPVGQIDELIELIQIQIEPRSWETTLGADLAQINGRILVIRQFSDVADKVQRFVAKLERQIMRVVTVDVQAVRLSSEQVRTVLRPGSDILVDAGKLAELLTPDAMGPGAAVSAYDRHRCAVFSGHQHAFVGDYDVEVAEEAQISDPIVYVSNLGMSAAVRPILSADASTCLLELNAWLGVVDDVRQVPTGEDRTLEAPIYQIARLVSKVEVPVGSWALIDGEAAVGDGRWVFLVRADAALGASGRMARSVALESPVEKPARRFEMRSFDIGMLNSVVYPQMAEIPFLAPSNFSPAEPPELSEPMPLLNQDAIVELLRASVAPSSWDTLADASIATRNGRLYVRNAPDVLDAITKNLGVLRREFLATVVTTAEVIEVDGALASELEGAPDRLLTESGQAQLAAALAANEASRKGSVRVTNMGGTRNAAVNGRKITYLSDYEVEIAKGAVIANPIVQSCISGALLDIESVRTAADGSVQVILRFMQTKIAQPIREVMTPHGNLELPRLDVLRVRTSLRIPVGRTMVVASAGEGGMRTLLLLTPRVATGGR